jgi:hypothetical protein
VHPGAAKIHLVAARAQGIDDRQVGIQALALLLEIRDLQVVRAKDLAGVRRFLPYQHAQQGGFSAAVLANQSQAAAWPKEQIDAWKMDLPA